ncbi:hypothetical protein SAMN05877809_101490 [Rhodobacter sp. JA431]|nr:hypothetical protein SAMN05877809_101490 [Rhodobacter sp. JA431]
MIATKVPRSSDFATFHSPLVLGWISLPRSAQREAFSNSKEGSRCLRSENQRKRLKHLRKPCATHEQSRARGNSNSTNVWFKWKTATRLRCGCRWSRQNRRFEQRGESAKPPFAQLHRNGASSALPPYPLPQRLPPKKTKKAAANAPAFLHSIAFRPQALRRRITTSTRLTSVPGGAAGTRTSSSSSTGASEMRFSPSQKKWG